MAELTAVGNIGTITTQLSSEKAKSYREFLEMRAAYYNSQEGQLKFYNCQKCHNKGVIAFVMGEYDEVMKPCECMTIRSCYQAMVENGFTDKTISEMTFDNFHDYSGEWQTRMKSIAHKYVESDLTSWLVMSGMTGTGKTHLCTAVAKELMQKGHDVKYVLWHDVVRRISAYKFKPEEYERYMKDVINAEVLYIDDLFKSDKAEKGIAFEVINARYIGRKPTIISTELNIQAIEEIDRAIAGRIGEMSRGFCAQIKEAPDRNQRKNI